jgi:ATP-dependent DNA helicase RecG
MEALRGGTIQILVATTVVEVGLDVPNATVMVVEHADRFGLSQLHQLRGRIGRGSHQGTCVLMTGDARSENAFRRLDIMCRTSDGFRIAEEDLEIRGPGEFVGTRQSGIPQFQFGNIVRDRRLLELAAREAQDHLTFLTQDAKGEGKDQLARLADQWRSRFGLFDVG